MKRLGWILKMAWRDGRAHAGRFVLFAATISFGIAAIMATGSFRVNLQRSLEQQAKSLLGADLMLSSNRPVEGEAMALMQAVPGESMRLTTFASMVWFEGSGDTRLARIKAVEVGYPFFGEIETLPEGAGTRIGEKGYALLADSLMLQFDVAPGDRIRVGRAELVVAGQIVKTPGETAMGSAFAPLVLVAQADVGGMDLIKKGSRVRYERAYLTPPDFSVDGWVSRHEDQLSRLRLDADTVEERKRILGRAFDHLTRFLGLAGLASLLLGGIGVATAVNVFIRQKAKTIALIRCLGAPIATTEAIFLVQAGVMGLLGSVFGLVFGAGLVTLLPLALGAFVPLDIDASLVLGPSRNAFLWGVGLTLVFTAFPLARIRLVSPLAAFRSGFRMGERDRLKGVLAVLAMAAMGLFSADQMGRMDLGLGLTLAIGVVLLLLAGAARVLARLTRRVIRRGWPFHWRQGLANLFRPNNISLLTIVALGFSVFVLLSLVQVHFSLMRQLDKVNLKDRGNLLLFDIQDDQVREVERELEQQGAPVLASIPIVTMRLSEIRGQPLEQYDLPDWAVRWEFRSTYRRELREFEQVIEGHWIGWAELEDGPIPISIEQEIAETLEIQLGDELTFDVQGIDIAVKVASLRTVEWQSMQPNFYIVFPAGVLEPAPKVHLVLSRTRDGDHSATLQRRIVAEFPNVSLFDLRALIETVEGIASKISVVLRFMTAFIALTGFLILAAAIYSTHAARAQEGAVLKALGARNRTVLKTALSEFFWLASFAAVIGGLASLLAVFGLTRYVFEVDMVVAPFWITGIGLALVLLTQVLGFASHLRTWRQSPMQALRGGLN